MSKRALIIRIVVLGVALAVVASCQTMEKSGPRKAEVAKRMPDSHEFEDVLVPREMDIDKQASLIYRNGGKSAGLMRLAGRVEMNSLMRFFENNMPKDGWRLISKFRSPQSLMIFQKANRMCVIAIEDSDLRTFMDVWVVPLDESSPGGARAQ
jgi:hypothetical protein